MSLGILILRFFICWQSLGIYIKDKLIKETSKIKEKLGVLPPTTTDNDPSSSNWKSNTYH